MILKNIWNYELLEKQYFSDNLNLADIAPAYKIKDPPLVVNYRPVSVLTSVSNIFERTIQKQFSSYIEKFLSPYVVIEKVSVSPLFTNWKIEKALDKKSYAGAI